MFFLSSLRRVLIDAWLRTVQLCEHVNAVLFSGKLFAENPAYVRAVEINVFIATLLTRKLFTFWTSALVCYTCMLAEA